MLTDSEIEVIWDPDYALLQLVSLGDPMFEEVLMDGGQAVQVSAHIRAAGVNTFGRGNEQHTLTFSLAVIMDTIALAEQERLERALGLPRGTADVLLRFASGRQFRLRNATLRGWPNAKDGRISRITLEIIGGVYEADFGTYTALSSWGSKFYLQPGGDKYLQPASAGEYLRP